MLSAVLRGADVSVVINAGGTVTLTLGTVVNATPSMVVFDIIVFDAVVTDGTVVVIRGGTVVVGDSCDATTKASRTCDVLGFVKL